MIHLSVLSCQYPETGRQLWNDYILEVVVLQIFNQVYREQYQVLHMQERLFN